MWRSSISLALAVLTIGALSMLPAGSAAEDLSSDWAQGHNSRVRLIAGDGLAGVELQMPVGWKTYWRNPGMPVAFRRPLTGRSLKTLRPQKCSILHPSDLPTVLAIPWAIRRWWSFQCA